MKCWDDQSKIFMLPNLKDTFVCSNGDILLRREYWKLYQISLCFKQKYISYSTLIKKKKWVNLFDLLAHIYVPFLSNHNYCLHVYLIICLTYYFTLHSWNSWEIFVGRWTLLAQAVQDMLKLKAYQVFIYSFPLSRSSSLCLWVVLLCVDLMQ